MCSSDLDRVVFSPSNKTVTVRSIEAFNAAARSEIGAGHSTGFTLSEEIYITRGEVMSHAEHPPMVSTRLRVNMIWLGKKPMSADRDYKLKLGTYAGPVRIARINRVFDASKLEGTLQKGEVGRHDVADLVLETRSPVAFDLALESEATGRFVIVDGYDIAGGGIVTGAEADQHDGLRAEARLRDFHWVPGGVTDAQRRLAYGHGPALVMVVGKPGVGKHGYARAIETALFAVHKHVSMLDGTNVLLGLDHDLGVDAARAELVRRFGEVANLLLRSGQIVVSTTNAIGLADHGAVQTLIGDMPSLAVEIDPDGTSTTPCDLRLSGKESNEDVVRLVVERLKAKGVF